MSKIKECELGYIIERIDSAVDKLEEVWCEYRDTGDIESVDDKLVEAYALVTLVNERLKKLSE